MAHTLRPVPVPKPVRDEYPDATAYELSGCKIIITPRDAAFGLLHCSVSRLAKDRLPSMEELSALCAKVPEIDVPMAIYMNAAGPGIARGSKVIHLWEWSPTKTPPIFAEASEN